MRALLFETRTGEFLDELELLSWQYSTGILAADKVTVSVPAYTERAHSTAMRELLLARRHSVALVDDANRSAIEVPAAGSIESVDAEQDDDGRNRWELVCFGPERVLSRAARVRKFPGWPLIDSEGLPTGAHDLTLAGLEYGTIMKRLVQEAMKFPGGSLPIDFEADRLGTRQRTYEAIDGKELVEALDDLADLQGGVEYDFQPKLTASGDVRFHFATGTDADRIVAGPRVHSWSIGGRLQQIRGWRRQLTAGTAATDAVFTGGKTDDRVLMARASSSALIDSGWPRVEVWDASHSSVSEQSTLQSWADSALGAGSERVSFQIRHTAAPGLRHGDLVELSARGHWDMPDGETDWRVLSVERKSDAPDWLDIQLVR